MRTCNGSCGDPFWITPTERCANATNRIAPAALQPKWLQYFWISRWMRHSLNGAWMSEWHWMNHWISDWHMFMDFFRNSDRIFQNFRDSNDRLQYSSECCEGMQKFLQILQKFWKICRKIRQAGSWRIDLPSASSRKKSNKQPRHRIARQGTLISYDDWSRRAALGWGWAQLLF